MNPIHQAKLLARRNFLTTFASGAGGLAMASLLQQEGLLAAPAETTDKPLGKLSQFHFAPKAKNCIFVFLEGAPSQIDLYDPKPMLNKLDGQKLPESFTKNVRFAFIQKETAVVMGSPRKFEKHGQCGMELSDLLPNLSTCVDDMALIRSMHTEAFNHHPGQLLMNTGVPTFGRPSLGSWLNYGLGNPSHDLPGYVVLTAGRGTSGGASLWSSGFMPSNYQGVLFRNQGEPVLNLNNPPGVTREMQRRSLDALEKLNQMRYGEAQDQEIAARVSAYELAFRMQSAAPELIDLSGETAETLEAYGVNREDEPDQDGFARGGGKGAYKAFATNCVLARRLIERGVRFVNLYHASWDHHSNLDKELAYNAGMADQPMAALLKDLKQRGLLDETLVVFAGEFGRTPLGENRNGAKATGRDHHPTAFSLWMAGGGIKGGQTIGKTDEFGWNIVEDPIHINDLHATILKVFGIDHLQLTYRYQGRDFRLTDVAGKVVDKLIA